MRAVRPRRAGAGVLVVAAGLIGGCSGTAGSRVDATASPVVSWGRGVPDGVDPAAVRPGRPIVVWHKADALLVVAVDSAERLPVAIAGGRSSVTIRTGPVASGGSAAAGGSASDATVVVTSEVPLPDGVDRSAPLRVSVDGGTVVVLAPPAASTSPAEVQAVQQAVGQAVYEERAIGVPIAVRQAQPAGRFTSPVPDVRTGARVTPVARPSASEQARRIDTSREALGRVFARASADLVARHEQMVRNVTADLADARSRFLAAGASELAFTSTSVLASTAQVRARVTTWSSSQHQVATGEWRASCPTTTSTLVATLLKEPDGRWLVTDLTYAVVPGSGP